MGKLVAWCNVRVLFQEAVVVLEPGDVVNLRANDKLMEWLDSNLVEIVIGRRLRVCSEVVEEGAREVVRVVGVLAAFVLGRGEPLAARIVVILVLQVVREFKTAHFYLILFNHGRSWPLHGEDLVQRRHGAILFNRRSLVLNVLRTILLRTVF